MPSPVTFSSYHIIDKPLSKRIEVRCIPDKQQHVKYSLGQGEVSIYPKPNALTPIDIEKYNTESKRLFDAIRTFTANQPQALNN